MSESRERAARLFLRYASRFAVLRRLPLLGPVVSWASTRAVPRNKLVWAQVQSGPGRGLWLRLNPRTGGQYFQGGGESEVQEAIAHHLRPGMTFYDVGANIGFFALLGARLVGAGGYVVAFEADPEIAARLCEHVARNDLPWILAEQKAVWSDAGNGFFERIDPMTSPDRGLGHIASTQGANTISVKTVSLDDYVKRSPAPDFIKCDVEGAEVEVFRGARRLLAEKRPGILCEMHSEENRRVLREQFSAIGYRCEDCGPLHVLALPPA